MKALLSSQSIAVPILTRRRMGIAGFAVVAASYGIGWAALPINNPIDAAPNRKPATEASTDEHDGKNAQTIRRSDKGEQINIDPARTSFIGVRFVRHKTAEAEICGSVVEAASVQSTLEARVKENAKHPIVLVFYEPCLNLKEQEDPVITTFFEKHEAAVRELAKKNGALFAYVPCTGSAQFKVTSPKGATRNYAGEERVEMSTLFRSIYDSPHGDLTLEKRKD